jgi:GTP-binding protein YchF
MHPPSQVGLGSFVGTAGRGAAPPKINFMKTAIIGLPQVGKTSLFTILTGASSEGRLGSTKVNVGVTKVPDRRLDELAKIFNPPKITHATVEYVDMPALSKETLRDAAYVGSLRVVDAFAHVIRLFEDQTVMHVEGSLDPERDWRNLELELILSDLQVVENRLQRVEKDLGRMKSTDLEREKELLIACKQALEAERPLRELALESEDAKRLKGFQFLSAKPMLLVLNLGEAQASRLHEIEKQYREKWLAGRAGVEVTAVAGSIEAEIAQLPPEEARDYLESYGLKEPGVERLIQATYSLLGLMSFLTAGETEVRAWTVQKSSPAVKAAGAIHSDFEKKFIRAEVIHWQKLVDYGGYAQARQHGDLRLEGKEYIVQDGDVLVIRHG